HCLQRSQRSTTCHDGPICPGLRWGGDFIASFCASCCANHSHPRWGRHSCLPSPQGRQECLPHPPAQLSPPTRTQEDRCRQSRNLGTVPGGGVHVCVKLAGARQVIFPTHRTPLRFGEGAEKRGSVRDSGGRSTEELRPDHAVAGNGYRSIEPV